MRLKALFFVLLVVCMGTGVLAEEAVQDTAKVLLQPVCSAWSDREYKTDVVVKGKLLAPDTKETMDVDSSLSMNVRHKYTRREDDGLMPLEITVTRGEAVIRDKANDFEQKMEIASSSYPKLTVLLDKSCRPTDIIGIAGTRYAEGMPGLNYGNMIILFVPDMGGQARAVGEKWETRLTIPSSQETYNFVNTLKSVDAAAKTAVIGQDISWKPKNGSAVKAVVESTFSTEDGKLLKSHAECQVTQTATGNDKQSAPSRQEVAVNRANISVDIALIK